MGILLFLLLPLVSALAPDAKVAVIGATGRLGRQAVLQLAEQGIQTRCLVRSKPDDTTAVPSSLDEAQSSQQVAAYLQTFPNVELVQGDVSDVESLKRLLEGCNACLALHGAKPPTPIWKGLVPFLYPESDPKHPKQVNYVGVLNIIAAAKATNCSRIVRLTGKGENPWSIFSILINALGGLAKGWNYQGEQALRESGVDYTIIRPGILKESIDESVGYGLVDNGGDLAVTPVSHQQIAQLAIQSLEYPNCAKSTLTAMNAESGPKSYNVLLEQVRADRREFPDLLDEHKKAARVGGLTIVSIGVILLQTILTTVWGFFKA